MNRGITKENLLLILPPALTHDKCVLALAEANAGALAARPAEIDRARIISNIDGLDEAVLDILAQDFKVDWWDPQYSIDEKRRTLKGSWRVHKLLGTKAAVETAIRAIYPGTRVEEWFEYGGEPYHFRLWINLTDDDVDSERMRRVMDRLMFYKSLRSHNDEIFYFTELGTMPQVQGNVLCAGCHCGLDANVPAEKKPAPSYHASTQAGVGVGTICMSMDVFI